MSETSPRRLAGNIKVIYAATFLSGNHNAMTRALLQLFVLTQKQIGRAHV